MLKVHVAIHRNQRAMDSLRYISIKTQWFALEKSSESVMMCQAT